MPSLLPISQYHFLLQVFGWRHDQFHSEVWQSMSSNTKQLLDFENLRIVAQMLICDGRFWRLAFGRCIWGALWEMRLTKMEILVYLESFLSNYPTYFLKFDSSHRFDLIFDPFVPLHQLLFILHQLFFILVCKKLVLINFL